MTQGFDHGVHKVPTFELYQHCLILSGLYCGLIDSLRWDHALGMVQKLTGIWNLCLHNQRLVIDPVDK